VFGVMWIYRVQNYMSDTTWYSSPPCHPALASVIPAKAGIHFRHSEPRVSRHLDGAPGKNLNQHNTQYARCITDDEVRCNRVKNLLKGPSGPEDLSRIVLTRALLTLIVGLAGRQKTESRWKSPSHKAVADQGRQMRQS